jgi:polyisoprenoid-binding protein YceI
MLKKISTVAAIAIALVASKVSAQTFKADASKSSVEWLAKKITGQHNGDVQLTSGSLVLEKGAVKSGAFEVDLTTIKVLDMTGEYADKLLGHLKSDDFFSVDKFPKATLVITEGKKAANGTYDLKGNLTIKGITKPISFPATITTVGNVTTATSAITVDRTVYDIKYGSASFFDSLGDKAIDNNFLLTVKLVASTQITH